MVETVTLECWIRLIVMLNYVSAIKILILSILLMQGQISVTSLGPQAWEMIISGAENETYSIMGRGSS